MEHGQTKVKKEGGAAIRTWERLPYVWLITTAPALLVLLMTIVFSAIFGGSHLQKGWQAIWKTLFRFLRFTLILCIPLFALIPLYGFIVEKGKRCMLEIEKKRNFAIKPRTHWIFRPFQGIGIGLLFATKLLTVLQLVAGPTVTPSLLIPEGEFNAARLLAITAITLFISLVLCIAWTLDDMGIRYINRRDQELKMIGKYAGTIVPVVFGMYGLFGLFANYSPEAASFNALKIIVVLYPSFEVFSVAHALFLRGREELLSKKMQLKKVQIVERG